MKNNQVWRIEVPATLANLGSGYDALGLAISRHNGFVIQRAPQWRIGNTEVDPTSHLMFHTMQRAAERFGGPCLPVGMTPIEDVPRSRGLGSSATVRVAGLLAYEALRGAPVDDALRLAFLREEEGHPDNVWPALLGGLVICGTTARSVPLHENWEIAVCIPDFEISTPKARALLPAEVPHEDAVFNGQRVATLIAGLIAGDPDMVAEGVEDRLHQPYRAGLIPSVTACFEGARAAGGAPFVSGSGSTLAAFAPVGTAERVAVALGKPFEALGISTVVQTLRPRCQGAVVVHAGPDLSS